MRLSEFTHTFIEREESKRPISPWEKFAAILNEMHANNQTSDQCWTNIEHPTQIRYTVPYNMDGYPSTASVQMKRFAFYVYPADNIQRDLTDRIHKMLASPKKYMHNNCGNPNCFNPGHIEESAGPLLRQGTRMNQGGAHPMSKLNQEQAWTIFISSKSPAELAEKYGVSKATISMIRKKKIWKHMHELNAQATASESTLQDQEPATDA